MSDLLHIIDPRVALAIHLGVVSVVIIAILAIAGVLREPSRDGFGVYESGAAPGGPMRGMVAAPYFMVAVFFMIFDVEVAVLFAWAVAAPSAGMAGLIGATVFIAVLLAALGYLWMDGALETGPQPRRTAGKGVSP